jgi:hypothetical protein
MEKRHPKGKIFRKTFKCGTYAKKRQTENE